MRSNNHDCLLIHKKTDGNRKIGDITTAILQELIASCSMCGITNHIINRQSLECFSESLDWEDIQVQDMTISTCNTECVLVISKSVLIFPSYVIVQPQY